MRQRPGRMAVVADAAERRTNPHQLQGKNMVVPNSVARKAQTDTAADFDAIRLAVAHGIIVVEAGGNGNNNLDTWTNAGGLTILNRSSVNFTDSGAIMVGAALSPLPHNRAGFSN